MGLLENKQGALEPGNEGISLRRQCELLGINRSNFYYEPVGPDEDMVKLMNIVDKEYTDYPMYGSRRMAAHIRRQGIVVNRKRIQHIYCLLGIEAIYPKPNLSKPAPWSVLYPYLLRGVRIKECDHVWSSDITYIRLQRGFVYLVAIIDWYSRYVLDWSLSTTLEANFCVETLARALQRGLCQIFNTDQGCQFTAAAWLALLTDNGIKISMDGRGRALDNVFIERLWRSLKQELVYRCELVSVAEARDQIGRWINFYNHRRVHQSLNYRTPSEVYFERKPSNMTHQRASLSAMSGLAFKDASAANAVIAARSSLTAALHGQAVGSASFGAPKCVSIFN